MARASPAVGQSAAVALIEWFELSEEVLLVMERPLSSVDLSSFCLNSAPVPENQAKVRNSSFNNHVRMLRKSFKNSQFPAVGYREAGDGWPHRSSLQRDLPPRH